MKQLKRYTPSDLKIIQECVKETPYNLSDGFRKATRIIFPYTRSMCDSDLTCTREFSSVSCAWYYAVRSNKIKTCFLLFSKKSGVVNRKIVRATTRASITRMWPRVKERVLSWIKTGN